VALPPPPPPPPPLLGASTTAVLLRPQPSLNNQSKRVVASDDRQAPAPASTPALPQPQKTRQPLQLHYTADERKDAVLFGKRPAPSPSMTIGRPQTKVKWAESSSDTDEESKFGRSSSKSTESGTDSEEDTALESASSGKSARTREDEKEFARATQTEKDDPRKSESESESESGSESESEDESEDESENESGSSHDSTIKSAKRPSLTGSINLGDTSSDSSDTDTDSEPTPQSRSLTAHPKKQTTSTASSHVERTSAGVSGSKVAALFIPPRPRRGQSLPQTPIRSNQDALGCGTEANAAADSTQQQSGDLNTNISDESHQGATGMPNAETNRIEEQHDSPPPNGLFDMTDPRIRLGLCPNARDYNALVQAAKDAAQYRDRALNNPLEALIQQFGFCWRRPDAARSRYGSTLHRDQNIFQYLRPKHPAQFPYSKAVAERLYWAYVKQPKRFIPNGETVPHELISDRPPVWDLPAYAEQEHTWNFTYPLQDNDQRTDKLDRKLDDKLRRFSKRAK